jgi:hypothetical protein
MENLEELKKIWQAQRTDKIEKAFDEASLYQLLRKKMKKENNNIMKYFWASFIFNIMVYAMSAHVIIRYWDNPTIFIAAMIAILATIPFTAMMLKKYKGMAVSFAKTKSRQSIQEYITRQKELLMSFFKFKRRYEWFLIPLNSAIGVIIVFSIFVPGGILENLNGALITYGITLASCAFAIISENKRSFIQPLNELQAILDEFKNGQEK